MRLLTLALLLAASTASAQTFSSLEERMSVTQFRAAGLDKLSEQELATLNEWLRNHTQQATARPAGGSAPAGTAVAAADRNGFEGERTPVYSRIDGTFTGWGGGTRFRLANGQVWQQVEADRWEASMENPEVEIRPKLLGSWLLRVEGSNRTVRVKRVE